MPVGPTGSPQRVRPVADVMPVLRGWNFAHGLGEVRRDWRFETHFVGGTRMTEGELPGVQHLTRKISGAFAAV